MGEIVGKVLLANAFSLGMLKHARNIVSVCEIDLGKVKEVLKDGFESAIGHEATAQLLSNLLGIEVKPQRKQIKLEDDDVLVVFQLLQRLPEGKILSEKEIQQIPYKFYLVRARQKHNHLDVADALSW